ncbi:hypothetical protein Tco_1000929 [Tanacetum coccineum]
MSTILKYDSAELVSGGANGLVKVSLSNSATSSFVSIFVELSGEFVASLFGEVIAEGASLSIEVEEDAPVVSSGGRVVAEMGLDATLRFLKKLFKTLSHDVSRSLNFDLFSDQEEYSKKEVAERMAETMEQYMSKTRANYGSGIDRPKIDDKEHFELKGQFLKELCDNTFSGSDHEDANEHIEKVLEIIDLFHIPNITQDQVMLRVFPMSLTGAASRWLRNKPSGSIKTWEDLKAKFLSKYCLPARTAKKMEDINNFQQEPDETLYQAWERFKELLMKCPQHYLTEIQEVILFYNGLEVPTRQILDSRGAIPTKTAADAKQAIQEMAEYSQKWHNRIGQEVLKLLVDWLQFKHNSTILEEKSRR